MTTWGGGSFGFHPPLAAARFSTLRLSNCLQPRFAGRRGFGAGAGATSAAGATVNPVSADAEAGGAVYDAEGSLRFRHIAGIVNTDDKVRFARIVFRASAGHAVVRFADVSEPLVDEKGDRQTKTVFTIFYRGRTLGTKLDRICTAFSAHQHDIPSFSEPGLVRDATEEARDVMERSMGWLRNEAENSATTLRHLALLMRKWRTGVAREKAVYHTLNMFLRQPERGTVSAHAWVLKTAVQQVHDTIQDAHAAAASGGRMQPYYLEVLRGTNLPQPPTHFHTNKVTKVFQGIVNTYGVPRYGEANPALFSIITFPFLFGVMYGDIGHSLFLTIAAGYVLLREEHFLKQKLGEMFVMAFKGRYMLFMMGCFGIYCGIIYNDFFSVATSSFGGTRWVYPTHHVNHTLHNGTVVQVSQLATVAVKKEGWADVYPFGVDPVWHSADNDLLFFNSLKMKMSVVIGIIQMTFGLILKLMNAIHFGSKADLFLEAIPQLIFMVALFGYMVFLIILKWCINWNDPATSPGAPPSLIDTLINVVLKPGTVNDQMFASQPGLQVIILLIVFFTVPIMLFGKPLAAHYAGKAAKKRHEEEQALMGGSTPSLSGAAHGQQVDTGALVVAGSSAYGHEGAINGGAAGTGLHQRITSPGVESPTAGLVKAGGAVATAGGHGHEGGGHDDGHGAGDEHHSFGDVFVHQAIETIEFVLGSVSNTASYLRLWALSLAHSQLATVFWERALVSQIETGNFFLIFIGWGAFACVTIGVLLLMDVLECFLHALRLHWVEFQNKFYKADGYKFMPFSFAALAEVEE